MQPRIQNRPRVKQDAGHCFALDRCDGKNRSGVAETGAHSLPLMAATASRDVSGETLALTSLLKNPNKLSFRGAEGDEESRTSILFRARFLRLASLGDEMTRLRNVFQQTVTGLLITKPRISSRSKPSSGNQRRRL